MRERGDKGAEKDWLLGLFSAHEVFKKVGQELRELRIERVETTS